MNDHLDGAKGPEGGLHAVADLHRLRVARLARGHELALGQAQAAAVEVIGQERERLRRPALRYLRSELKK